MGRTAWCAAEKRGLIKFHRPSVRTVLICYADAIKAFITEPSKAPKPSGGGQ